MTRKEALRQNPASPCPREILDRQILVRVRFYDFAAAPGEGTIVVDGDLEKDIAELFSLILENKFPVASVVPVASPRFLWDDDRSMRANNTSGFNYRPITGDDSGRHSTHALGRAIDINPLLNPYIREGVIKPEDAVYDPTRPGTISADLFIVKFLKERGWNWGGDWMSPKDYQHFEKV